MTARISRLGVIWLVMGTLLLTSAACGVGVDDEPRALPVTTTSTSVPTDPSGDEFSVLYMSQAEQLVPITRNLSDRTPQSVMESLLVPPQNEGSGLSSAIPAGTEVLSIEEEGGVVTVNLSEAFDDVVGTRRQLALGQMVESLVPLDGVERVAFEIEGEPLEVTTSAGDVFEVGECDYAELLADPVAETTSLGEGQLILLQRRRDNLAESCGL